jgi:hypothetical protein
MRVGRATLTCDSSSTHPARAERGKAARRGRGAGELGADFTPFFRGMPQNLCVRRTVVNVNALYINSLLQKLEITVGYGASLPRQRHCIQQSCSNALPQSVVCWYVRSGHPDTLSSVDALALVLQDQGKYKAAEEMN